MKRKLMHNFSLKIAALLFAVIAWFLVVNISDPVRTNTYTNVPITVANSSYIESMGLSGQLKQDTVSVTISDKLSVVKKIDTSDIVVTADLTQIINMDSDPVMVPLSVSCTKYPNISSEDITVTPKNVAINLEKLASADFVVTASTDGTKPDIDYEVGTMSVEPEKITISGPESIINKIDKVVAKVNVTGLKQDATLKGDLVVIDKNQDALKDNQMAYLTLQNLEEDKKVSVDVVLWEVKKDVMISASASGTPKEGYQVGEVKTTPSKISLVGSKQALEQLALQGNVIEIPPSEIDVTGLSSDFEIKINISDFLPEEIRLATDVSSSVLVTTTILPYGSEDFEIPVENITTTNLGKNMVAVLGENEVTVRLKGTDAQLAGLKAEDIKGTVDLEGLETGTHTVSVQVELPAGMTLVEEPETTVTISSTETTTEETGKTASKTK